MINGAKVQFYINRSLLLRSSSKVSRIYPKRVYWEKFVLENSRKMNQFFFMIFFFLWNFTITRGSYKSGFIFVAPKTFLSGYNEKLCITYRNEANRNITGVSVKILEQKKNRELAFVKENITEVDRGEKCFKILIEKTKHKKGRLQLTIHLKTDVDLNINFVEQISIQTNTNASFIQTDKSVYNGGELVRFIIFTLTHNMTPSMEPVEKIWIENPNGIHLVQWLNEPVDGGFINKSFQISNEPVMGAWSINMKRYHNDETVSQNFLVENYVLPKFSVTIKSPEYVNLRGNITICARYLFNEPVHGEALLRYFVECSFKYYCQEDKPTTIQGLRLSSNGCIDHEIILNNVSNFAQSLIVDASVIEDGTGTRAKALSKIEIKNSKNSKFDYFSAETKVKKFKLGLPFKGQVIKPLHEQEEEFVLCIVSTEMRTCKKLSFSKNYVSFVILPIATVTSKTFKAFIEVRKGSNGVSTRNYATKLNLVPWYSSSGNYLQVESLAAEAINCSQMATFNLIYSSTEPIYRLHYVIKSRGSILDKGSLNDFFTNSKPFKLEEGDIAINEGDINEVRQFKFRINISSNMSPRSYLLVYFITNNGEVVADTLPLHIKHCLKSKVNIKWKKNIASPGSDNALSIQTLSNSKCAVMVTDRSVKLNSLTPNMNMDRILNEVEKLYLVSDSTQEKSGHCKDVNNKEVGNKDFGNVTEGLMEPKLIDSLFIDSLQAFKEFGALVITDLDLGTRPCTKKSWMDSETRNSHIHAGEMENITVFNAEEFANSHYPNTLHSLDHEPRTYFPETWIWDLVQVNDSGVENLNFRVPDTLTEWIAETFCFSKEHGIGIANQASFVSHQPFFLDFSVPHSLTRKEVLHLQVSVFNYESSELPVTISYLPSTNFKLKSEKAKSYCIRSKTKIVHHFALEAVKLGAAEILIKAEIGSNFTSSCGSNITGKSDFVVKKIIIKPEGLPVDEVKSAFICGDASNFQINFDSNVAWNIKIPADVVESSVSVAAVVSGDILAPALKNVDRLIMLPTGCGEQNMALLVPNILLLDYVLTTNSRDLTLAEKAKKNLHLGYQKQLNYKRFDDSYSAFGERDEKGSIWLTAFVVRYLSRARKYIHVDKDNLNASLAWIMKQQLENGCFPVIGKIYHRNLEEKLLEEDSSKTLTAYILISLIESGIPVENSVIKSGIHCLKTVEESLGPYGDLLSSYALIMAGEYRDSQASMMKLMAEAKRSYGLLWWESEDSDESSIEMTSYGILTLLKLGGSHFQAAASNALRWIIQHQNQNGGFVSSQDTVAALEAVTKYSASISMRNDWHQLNVTVSIGGKEYIFNISESNRILEQRVNLPVLFTDIHFKSVGKGCALVQTHSRYNIRPRKPSADMKVHLKIQSISNVSSNPLLKFHICIRHKSKKNINMAVLEVNMISGYYPDLPSLFKIRTSTKGIRRWEELEEKIAFYFEDLKNKKICLTFLAVQDVCVEKAAPAIIKFYNYYNRNHGTIVKYGLMEKCENSTRFTKRKQTSKRDLNNDESILIYSSSNNEIEGFFDSDSTPIDLEDETPMHAFSPAAKNLGSRCPRCPTDVPFIFPHLYCSSQTALKVLILNKNIIQFKLNLSPQTNFTSMKHTVLYVTNEQCKCSILNSVKSYALMLVTPPRSFIPNYMREIVLDDSVQLYPWGDPNKIPQYVADAISYCQKWPLDIK